MITSYVALGSNLQNPESQLQAAVAALDQLEDVRVAATSPVYRSAAVGPGEQPDYLNAAVALITALPPLELLAALQDIEDRQGRQRGERWGPRTLDLDILLYGDQHIDLPRLQVPHPRLAERNFALVPLADLCSPKLQLPDGSELGTLLEHCPPARLERTRIRLEALQGR
jgi:2-amino-4-hydroxy-6-hydroxymethyldihydropteridine diphosphokinase